MANKALDAQVAAIHAGSQRSYGRPRIVRGLHEQGVQASHERVRNSLKRQGLRPVYKRPYRVTTDSAHDKPIAPNVLDRRFNNWQLNQAWVGDITYLPVAGRWRFLAVVLDQCSRRVLAWRLGRTRDARLTQAVLDAAVRRRHPRTGLIFHSDRP